MNEKKLLALAVVVGGLFYLWKTGALDALLGSLGLSSAVALTPEQQRTQQDLALGAQTLAAEEDAYAKNQATIGGGKGAASLAIGGASTAAGVVSGIAGVAASTVLLATGIAAAGGLLVWGITQKGWFRGGEEGVKVNPARDQFIKVWVDTYFPGQGSAKQFEAMAQAFADAHVRGDVAERTIAQLYAADTMNEFKAAAENFLNVLQTGV